MKLVLLALLAALLMLTPAASAQAGDPLAIRPLRRGINLSHWYAQWGDYSEARLARYITAADVKLIADMGFDHVRLTLDDTVVFADKPASLKADNIERLKQRIRAFIDAGVAVLVDLHPEERFKIALRDHPETVTRLVADWGALAEALKAFDPKWVALEVMNEPAPIPLDAWRAMQRQMIDAIRAAAPRHTIIANPGGWSSITDLTSFKPYEGLSNVLYTFHCYDPHIYTHQAAEWGWPIAARVRGLNWPLEPGQGKSTAAATARQGDKEATGHVEWLVDHGELSEAWLMERIASVRRWQQQHGDVPVYAGEFGVYAKVAPRASRLRWLKAVRTAFESYGWGWAMWDYAGGFSVAEGPEGARTPDNEVLQALGMRP